ncbi:MAG: LeuA family protein [Acidobacteriota bacterium]
MSASDRDLSELIHDWNTLEEIPGPRRGHVELDDETLRDGLQNPSVQDPELEDKKRLLHLMNDLGIDSASLGLPGAGPKAFEHVKALCEEIRDQKLNVTANCAGRTMVQDAEPMVRITQETGVPIEACLFIGSSPIRQFVESWTVNEILKRSTEAVSYAAGEGLPVMYVTEDTTRADPETIRRLYTAAVEAGARRVCVCDTVGHSTPRGAFAVTKFVREVVDATGEEVKVDWHGHRDRGLAVANCLAAIEAGADRVHGCGIGIGERVGNAEIELLLVNLMLLGWSDRDLSKLPEYCEAVSRAVEAPIPRNLPIVGDDAFETATGVHAAAVIKAAEKGSDWLADRVYSGVPAGSIGRRQVIKVGIMSGRSNVAWWLRENGHEVTDDRVAAILAAAKQSRSNLTDEELERLVSAS